MTARAPLDGLRVLAVPQFGAGPWVTMHLAEALALRHPGGRAHQPHVGRDVLHYDAERIAALRAAGAFGRNRA